MKLKVLAVPLGFAIVLAGGLALPGDESTKRPVSDRELGLSKTSVLEIPAPEAFEFDPGLPGEGRVLPRAYAGAPPRIPHAIADFVPITRSQNLCLDCHELPDPDEGADDDDPPPVPPSHRIDLRRGKRRPGEGLAGARHTCTLCHVPRTDAAPLVRNRF